MISQTILYLLFLTLQKKNAEKTIKKAKKNDLINIPFSIFPHNGIPGS